ncbi:MAG: hypothetical protein JHC32_04820 [Candidatus Aminicenantes bacterium]|jgi:hypothetical protein|nr:hypothetical protein [Candidatus Aminicenantes bacterium]
MEIIILKEPWQDLWLLSRSGLSARRTICGYLLGQKLNQAYFVQKICQFPYEELSEPQFFLKVEKNQKLKILGIFCLNPSEAKKKNFARPLFCEKIFLSLSTENKRETKVAAEIIRFDRRFIFDPVKKISLEMEENSA